MGNVPFYLKVWAKLTQLIKKADFQSIFARGGSAAISMDMFNLSLIKSPLRAFR